MAFIISDDFQSLIPTGNWMYPVTDVQLPDAFQQLNVPAKSLSFSADKIDSNRKSWIREWQNALIQ